MKIRSGVTRNVLVLGKYVIKFPTFRSHNLFLNGCYSNHSERNFCKLWCNYEGDDDYPNLYLLVAPTKWCSWFGLIQIQERVDIIDRDLEQFEIDMFSPVCTDIKCVNFGIYKGRLVCVDYP